jgi:NADPH-dependent curcumin reductase CurA
VQFAKLAGARVITTAGSEIKADAAEALGADIVINYRTRDVDDALKETCPGGLDIVIDGVGGRLLDTLISHVKPGGKVLQIGYISEYPHTGMILRMCSYIKLCSPLALILVGMDPGAWCRG